MRTPDEHDEDEMDLFDRIDSGEHDWAYKAELYEDLGDL